MNVLLLDLSYFSIVSSLVSFSSVAEETCTSPALEFFADSITRAASSAFPFFTRLSYFQNSSSYARFFRCQQSIWSDPPFAHFNRSPFVLFNIYPRYTEALVILIFSRTSSLFESVNELTPRETPSSMKILYVS